MSRENVEVVRSLFEEYARHGVEPSAIAKYCAPDVVWNAADETPQNGTDAVRGYMERWESEWEELMTVPEEFIDAGESVLVTVKFSARGRASGLHVDARLYEVYTLRDGMIVRMDEFTERAVALEAAGLRE